MPNFPWPAHWEAPAAGDASLEELLTGEAGADYGAGLEPVAQMLNALRAAPEDDELQGEAAALAVFRGRAGVPDPSRRSRRWRRPVLTSLLSVKAGAAAAAAVLGLGGIATAAYARSLPAPLQRFAHDTIGAPSATASPAPPQQTHQPAAPGPDATGSAAFGLCTAYAHAEAHGSASRRAVAFRNLEKAAGGAAKVAAYCASVPHPGASPSHPAHPSPKPHPSARPSTSHEPQPAQSPRPTHGPHPSPKPHPSPSHPGA